MPVGFANLMTERIFVPKIGCVLALVSRASRSGIGFMTWTPFSSSARPLSHLRNGTTCFSFHRYSAVPMP